MSKYSCALIFCLLCATSAFGPSIFGPRAFAQCSTPVANADTVRAEPIVAEVILIDVLANDTDPAGSPLSVTVTGHHCEGVVSVGSFEVVTYVPSSNPKDCTINYRAVNEDGEHSTAQVTVDLIFEIFADGFETGNTGRWSDTQ